MSDIRFDNRVAIVTGAGGGLGRCHALLLGSRGAKVVVNDLGGKTDGSGASQSAADTVVKEITEAGGTAVANYDSVSTPEGGEAIVQTAMDNFGQVDILINNAGILRDKTFAKMSIDEINLVLDVHLRGAFYVTQPAFKVMKERGYGRLIFTTSAAGLFGNFGQANYGAAKMGLVGLSQVLAIEGFKNNIRSNVIAPIARTRMTEELLGPMADLLDPEQVTALVAYLCSEQCDITHETFSIGGGRYARAFVGVNQGWFAGKDVTPTVETVRDNIESIRNLDDHIVPDNATEELKILGQLFNS